MLKNLKWGELFSSKTFLGSFAALLLEGLKVLFPGHPKAMLAAQLLSALFAAIGIIDRTAPK